MALFIHNYSLPLLLQYRFCPVHFSFSNILLAFYTWHIFIFIFLLILECFLLSKLLPRQIARWILKINSIQCRYSDFELFKYPTSKRCFNLEQFSFKLFNRRGVIGYPSQLTSSSTFLSVLEDSLLTCSIFLSKLYSLMLA